MIDFKKDVALVVSSCDKYEDAWYPYFELVKKYWPERPEKIFLITETKGYSHPGLNVISCKFGKEVTWSERLYKTLEKAGTKYIVFSLEDFFLLDYVKQDRIEKCIEWMEEDETIAECRLHSSEYEGLIESEKYAPFRIAESDTPYRLDTQVALWNREALMSFVDLSENPWQFEGDGTKRIKDTDKKFLWLYSEDPYKLEDKIFPYRIYQWFGHGIAWGHWLWENKKWFKQNGINGVKYYRLGVLSERTVKLRFKHLYLYNRGPKKWEKLIAPLWREIIRIRKIKSNIMVSGLKEGLRQSWKQK
ncbi:MAG: hypothetical protein E7533_02780 [Ruminococcaceae bacterium]|nr:hypothetical protein [Oscillospiraceae bacterium]